MTYQVLARKWRPKTFKELVGQVHVLKALIHALDNETVHHAYLFTGTRGVGKTTIARILAKCLNCQEGVSSTPCDTCSTCQSISQGNFADLIEVDAASRTKVEDTRELLENVQYTPTYGRYKIYLIDEVHMLSNHSFNALLKTLEEPPEHVKFLLATTDPHKLPITILSRCLQLNLRNLHPEQISDHLAHVLQQENIDFEAPALTKLAYAAEGSMRDALSLLDQAIAFGGGQVKRSEVLEMLGSIEDKHLFTLLTHILSADGAAVMETLAQISQMAPNYQELINMLADVLYQISVAQVVPNHTNKKHVLDEEIGPLASLASPEDIQLLYQIVIQGKQEITIAPSPKMGFEMTALRMYAFRPVDPSSLITQQPSTQVVSQPVQATQPVQSNPTLTQPIQQKTAAPKPISQPVAEKQQAQAPVKAESQTPSNTPLPSLEALLEQWPQIVKALKLNGIAHMFAQNSVVKAIDDKLITLSLANKHKAMNTPKTLEKLTAQLSNYLQRSIKIAVQPMEETELTDEGNPKTPAVIANKQAADLKQETFNQFQQDPNVQTLADTFGSDIDKKNVVMSNT